MLQAVRRCRRWASAHGAARLVLQIRFWQTQHKTKKQHPTAMMQDSIGLWLNPSLRDLLICGVTLTMKLRRSYWRKTYLMSLNSNYKLSVNVCFGTRQASQRLFWLGVPNLHWEELALDIWVHIEYVIMEWKDINEKDTEKYYNDKENWIMIKSCILYIGFEYNI